MDGGRGNVMKRVVRRFDRGYRLEWEEYGTAKRRGCRERGEE